MSQLRQQEQEFESRNVKVVVVTFDSPNMAQCYVNSKKLKWPMLIDEDRKLYSAYGMPRASWWKLGNPVVIWKYVVNIVTGNWPGMAGKDIKQLGGDVLIDPNGNVVLNHVCIDPHDRQDSRRFFDLIDQHDKTLT